MPVLRLLRDSGNTLVRLYLRHPARFVLGGAVWWIAYVVLLEVVLGIDVATSIDKALRVTFAIESPRDAVIGASHVPAPFFIAAAGWMGWSVIIYFTFLIPALVAAMVERLPALATSLSPLIPPQAREFIEEYSVFLKQAMLIMLHDVAGVDAATKGFLEESRVAALRAIADLVRTWYLDQDQALNANASFMRRIRGRDYVDLAAPVLYSDKLAGDNDWVLELVGFAYEFEGMPIRLLLAVDENNPSPGAPYGVVHREPDGIADTRDQKEWRRRGVSGEDLIAVRTYFADVPFRSFISIPVTDAAGSIVGALSLQVDQPQKFVMGNEETTQLVALIEPICYFFAWLEKKR